MTPIESIIRLIIYVLISMVTTASAGVTTVDFTDARSTTAFVLAIVASGLITARTYIDKSSSQIEPK
jgi:hypothetical protein